jgi:hypothetical protein
MPQDKEKGEALGSSTKAGEKGVAFVADGGVERGSAGLSRCDITWPNRRSDLRLGKHPLYHPGYCVYSSPCCWEETLPQALPEALLGTSPSQVVTNQPPGSGTKGNITKPREAGG